MIDNLTIRRIKETANIVDVIGDFYELHKRGVEYECKCPFHEDRHLGSFKISERKNYAKCFSCGWQGGPIDFLMQHERLNFADALRWLGKKYSIEVEGEDWSGGFDFAGKKAVPRQQLPPLPMLVLPQWMVTRSEQQREDNTLVKWIRSLHWDGCQRKRIDGVLADYHVGHAKNGMAMFWQIDERQQVRTGKMMTYKPDGHRDKEARYGFDWIHSALYRTPSSGYSPDKTDVKPCLFGLHLLEQYRAKEVCIVESEKTALLMAIAYGNNAGQVWMACGGVSVLNREKLKPIIDRKCNIRLYPDRDAIDRWKVKAEQLHYERVALDTDPVTKWWKPEDGEKADIGDVVVRLTNNHKTYKTVGEVIEDLPIIKQLHEKLNLEIVNEPEE